MEPKTAEEFCCGLQHEKNTENHAGFWHSWLPGNEGRICKKNSTVPNELGEINSC